MPNEQCNQRPALIARPGEILYSVFEIGYAELRFAPVVNRIFKI